MRVGMERNRLLFSLFGITTLAGVLLGGDRMYPHDQGGA